MRSKYRNVPTVLDGIRFASKREAKRWSELKLMEKAGKIFDLERQVSFPIVVEGEYICGYVCDFSYRLIEPAFMHDLVVEDVKGVKTPIYRLKKKLVRAVYGIDVVEV